MDWLPSGLILNDPVWVVFLGSTWEMAHSISSTRARHATMNNNNTGEGQTCTKTTKEGLCSACLASLSITHPPPHLMSWPWRAAWVRLPPRSPRSRHVLAKSHATERPLRILAHLNLGAVENSQQFMINIITIIIIIIKYKGITTLLSSPTWMF